jgi:AcrR family transcriptional regulator
MATRLSAAGPTGRRAPTQQRSRATVDALVEAAARVLGARGWAAFTTNEVARVAGASIGSLYQYFPDKLALAEAIRARHLRTVLAVLPDPDAHDRAQPLAIRVAQVIDGVIAIHSSDQRLHRVLLEDVPLAARGSDQAFEAEYLRRYQALLPGDAGQPANPGNLVAARMLAAAVEGTVHAAASRGELAQPEVRRELNGMVCAYLRERGARIAGRA